MRLSKRIIRFIIFSFCAIAVVSLLFMSSSNNLRAAHQDVLFRLGRLRAQDSIFKTEVFRVRSFLTPNFDALVKSAETLNEYCQSVVAGASPLTNTYGREFDTLLTSYCSDVAERIEMSEELKSSVSIVRNSSRYLPELSESPIFSRDSAEEKATSAVLISTLAYLSDTSSDAARHLSKDTIALEKLRKRLGKLDPASENLLRHSHIIAKLLPSIDDLLFKISDNSTREKMLAVQPAYVAIFSEIEARARIFQVCLVVSFIGILFFAGFLLVKLWRSTEALAKANLNLEERVLDRTRALNESIELVREQQASLVQSSKLSALGEMAGGIAHEINTPLAIISLSVQNLRFLVPTDGENAEFALELCGNIEETTARIAKIVSGLRKISRNEEAEEPSDTRLSQVIEETSALCKERFAAFGTDFTVLPFDQELVLCCRQVQISQVLLNLLNNSHDAIQNLSEQWIKLEVSQNPAFIEISITDSGKGIPQAIRDKIMQPFFTTKPVGKGTGLGLSLSASIMRGHGGELMVDQKSPNTKFILRFPRKGRTSAAA